MKLPPKLGPIHFIGIGGIGMSGIAEVMHNLGYTRAGLRRVRQLQRQAPRRERHPHLRRPRGRAIRAGPRSWSSRRRSSATTRNSPRRARSGCRWCAAPRCWPSSCGFKSCVAIAGTHGKTTTTSLVATLLDAGGLDPTVINGGIINAYGTNARMGEGRLDGGGGGRIGRHLPQAAGRCRHRHQYRSGASRPFPHVRRHQGRLPHLHRQYPVLRFRRDVHRSSGGAGLGRRHRGPARHHLRREPAGRRAPHRCRPARRPRAGSASTSATASAAISRSPTCRCRCPAITTRSTPRRRSPSRTSSASRPT